MKKVIALIIALVCLSSCIDYSEKTPIIQKADEPTLQQFTQIQKFSFEGHDYIWFRKVNGSYAGYDGGIVHDPVCERRDNAVRDTITVVMLEPAKEI